MIFAIRKRNLKNGITYPHREGSGTYKKWLSMVHGYKITKVNNFYIKPNVSL